MLNYDDDMDYCDLDPTKRCDNCCRCIDSGKDYDEYNIELTDNVEELDDMTFVSMQDELFDEDIGQSGAIAPLWIDPKLKAEWERKLREL